MKILITGATGLVGQKLVEALFLQGHTNIRVLTRNKKKAIENCQFPIEAFEWNPAAMKIEQAALENVDYVVHLAGDGVADGRWTKAKKERILSSRVNGTKLLIDSINNAKTKPKKVISASAIGYYGDRGSEEIDENSSSGSDFLADVCRQWEAPFHEGKLKDSIYHIVRIGVVLAQNGGALAKMLPPFKAGVAGKLGSGKQFMSWIHIDDLVKQFIFLIENSVEKKIYNAVAPMPVNNFQFTKTLGSILKRPTVIPTPAFGVRILFGEMADMLLGGQKVKPRNFTKAGYEYKFTELNKALGDILKHDNQGEEVLTKYQFIKQTPSKVFDFFSNEKNLEKITPPYLNFKVLKKSTEVIQEGTLIDYKLSLHGIPLKWRSKINQFKKEERFIDEQISGPYNKWVHTHDFIPMNGGTLIKDQVIYKVPMGVLGRIFAGPFVKKDVSAIFNYRKQIIGKLIV